MRTITIAAMLACFPFVALAQPGQLAKKFKSDFAIPESPAFTLVGEQPSQLLRPATVRELALELSKFVNDTGSFSVPHELGVELAPALLIASESLSLDEYNQRPALFRTRLSFAMRHVPEATVATKIGIGLRSTLIDHADMRSSPDSDEMRDEIRAWSREVLAVEDAAKIRLIEKGKYEPGDSIPETELVNDMSAEEKRMRSSLERRTRERMEQYKDDHWNAQVLEVAFGWLGASADTLGENARTAAVKAWISYGVPVTRHGQWLSGATAGRQRQDSGELIDVLDVASRFYFGINKSKVFVETGVTAKDEHKPVWLLNGGGEVRGPWDTWLDFTAGVDFDGATGDADMKSKLTLRIGTAE